MNETWLKERVSAAGPEPEHSSAVAEMWAQLRDRVGAFAASRPDVASATLIPPRRGLQHDESATFLRAMAAGIAHVDDAGFITLPTVQQKAPAGRYALFSKSGDGVSVNLEYIVQVGATAELILDHGWPAERIGFERGEFDAVAYDGEGQVTLAMEAKARVTGPDSLEKLVRAWIQFARHPEADLDNNAGRKWRELRALNVVRPIRVWLVADGARWTLTARTPGEQLLLTPGGAIGP